MTYPTVVLILAILAASFMLIFIVPIFAKIFADLGGTLPLPTRVAMFLSDLLTSIWGIFIYAAAGLGHHPEGRPRPLRPGHWYIERRWCPD
ncbi:MAG TPA: hypothetical protein VK357_17205, partial [Rubrobacteraceae bacterium]|nr:hypothetical protein [Rubrobacteraceae bacterium]